MSVAPGNMAYLEQCFPFDDVVLDAVSQTAERHNPQTISELAAKYGMENGPQIIQPPGACKPTEIADFSINPFSSSYQPDVVSLVHTSFGSSITKATIGRMLTLGVALNIMREQSGEPTGRVVVAGGSSAPGWRVGRLTCDQLLYTGLSHDLRHTVTPVLCYLAGDKTREIDVGGYSAAADKGAETGIRARRYGIRVKNAVFVASAALKDRSLVQFAKDFDSTKYHHKEYVHQSEWPDYIQACNVDSRYEDLRYRARLLRPTNLAVASALRINGYERRVAEFMHAQPEAYLTTGWAANDELAEENLPAGIAERLMATFNPLRPGSVQAMRFLNTYHAAMENPYLFTAMMLQGWRNGARARMQATATEQIPAEQHSIDLDRVA